MDEHLIEGIHFEHPEASVPNLNFVNNNIVAFIFDEKYFLVSIIVFYRIMKTPNL